MTAVPRPRLPRVRSRFFDPTLVGPPGAAGGAGTSGSSGPLIRARPTGGRAASREPGYIMAGGPPARPRSRRPWHRPGAARTTLYTATVAPLLRVPMVPPMSQVEFVGFDHVDIRVRHRTKLRRFLVEQLGLDVLGDSPDHTNLLLGNQVLGLRDL